VGPGLVSWEDLNNFGPQTHFDVLVNAASPNAQFALKNPELFCEWMSAHADLLIRLKSVCNIKQLVSISTTNVYSTTPQGSYPEESELRGTHPYALGHIELEGKLSSDAEVTIFRLSNSYGMPGTLGRLNSSLVANDFIRQALKAGRIDNIAEPGAARDFVTGSDLEKAVEFVLKRSLFGVFNLSSGVSTTLGDWAQLIEGLVSGKHEFSGGLEADLLGSNQSFGYPNKKLENYGFTFTNDYVFELANLIEYIREHEMTS
jgi:nucleoside-diphosphate-sugar epimerase